MRDYKELYTELMLELHRRIAERSHSIIGSNWAHEEPDNDDRAVYKELKEITAWEYINRTKN